MGGGETRNDRGDERCDRFIDGFTQHWYKKRNIEVDGSEYTLEAEGFMVEITVVYGDKALKLGFKKTDIDCKVKSIPYLPSWNKEENFLAASVRQLSCPAPNLDHIEGLKTHFIVGKVR